MKNIKDIVKYTIVTFIILSLVTLAFWTSSAFSNFRRCLENKGSDECLSDFFMSTPQIKGTQELGQACDEADMDCFVKIGEKVVTDKLQEETS